MLHRTIKIRVMIISNLKLKETIRYKFRTIKRFCIIAGIEDKYDYVRSLTANCFKDTESRRRNRLVYYSLALSTANKLLEDEISNDHREWIKKVIKSLYGSVVEFNNKYPQIPLTTLRDIIDGRTMTKTQAFDVLIETLKEDLDS